MIAIPRGLTPRLILALTVLVAVVEGGFSFFNVRRQEDQLLNEMVQGADQLSRSITSATWHTMLANQPDATYQIMETIGQKQGIESIRIFNKEGVVTFSTDPDAPAQVDMNAEACYLCHAREEPLVQVDVPDRSRIFRSADGHRKLAMVTPIYNEPACSQAACHAHPEDKSVLGVLDISMDLSHVDQQVGSVQNRAMLMAVVQIVLIGILIALFIRHFVGKPIRKLMEGTRAISHMDLDTRIDAHAHGELAALAESFNTMRERLRTAVQETNTLTSNLEHTVEKRTKELLSARQKLIQSDRMASLGQLAASVAHEINNPISGVLNLSMLMQRILKDDGVPANRIQDFRRYLQAVSDETARVGRIVTDLLSFSRRSAPQHTEADLNQIVLNTISLLGHKLSLGNVQLDMVLDDALPPVSCDPSQIQQVVINLVMNGAEALHEGGHVYVRTRLDAEGGPVLLEVEDSGSGIPEAIRAKIFDPFFTTKDVGKGVGLGLAVVYGIVEAHRGTIEVQSEVGQGTLFRVSLPLEPALDAADPVTQAARAESTG